MDNYEEIKDLLLHASALIVPGLDVKYEFERIKTQEDVGKKQQLIIRDLLSSMHLVMVHGK